MPRQANYSRAQASVIFDGQPLINIGDGDDAISLVGSESNSERTTGIDGTMISTSTDTSGTLSISLLPISPSFERIYPRYDAQSQGLVGLFSCEVSTGVGEIHSCKNCAIKSVGTMETGGGTGVARVIVLDVGKIKWDEGNN